MNLLVSWNFKHTLQGLTEQERLEDYRQGHEEWVKLQARLRQAKEQQVAS